MRIEKLSDAKNNLSKLIEEVRQGERIRIVAHGKPVADLVPIDQSGQQSDALEASLAELERHGTIRRGTGKLDPRLFQAGPGVSGEPISISLIEERRRGR